MWIWVWVLMAWSVPGRFGSRGLADGAPGAGQITSFVDELNGAVRRRDRIAEIRARIQLAETYQAMGHYCAATEQAELALALAESQLDQSVKLRARSVLAMVDLAARRLDRSEARLRSCLGEINGLGEAARKSSLLAALGALTVLKPEVSIAETATGARGMIPLRPKPNQVVSPALTESRRLFEAALGEAIQSGEPLLPPRVRLGRANMEMRHGEPGVAREVGMAAWRDLAGVQPGPVRDAQWILCARLFSDLSLRLGNGTIDGTELNTTAARICEDILDRGPTTESWARIQAMGISGEMRRRQGDLEQAMNRTLQALELSQNAGFEEARFEWTWQAARILKALGQSAKAAAAYDLAIEIFQPLRGDFLSSLAGTTAAGFAQNSVTDVYQERADLLLETARSGQSSESRQRLLEHASRTLERLRTTDLENFYLDDDCASLVRQNEVNLNAVQPGTAILYTLALSNRTEILVRFSRGLQSFVSPVGATQIRTAAQSLRRSLSTSRPEVARELGRQFHGWLIEPVISALREQSIHTLVFVPDRSLASIPPSAFLGPDGYLIEHFAIAISPGLSLMKSGTLGRGHMRPLLCGVSEGATGFSPLAGVREELEAIRKLTGEPHALMDGSFTTNAFAEALAQNRHQWIHIASHAYFGGDASQTFLLAGKEQRLTMDALEQLILPRMVSPKPIEVLVLSACETAAGDDRAAFGLAGLAVKSGVRTAIASLWQVNDQSTRELMTVLYREFQSNPGVSRAEVLRRAQRRMIQQPRFQDPYHWSPFILVGQW